MSPVTFYKCLADETRLNALLLIATKSELCVCDLTGALQLSQPKMSRHLAELRKCQILQDERRGKWVFYRIHPSLPEWAKTVLSITAEHHQSDLNKKLSLLSDEESLNKCC